MSDRVSLAEKLVDFYRKKAIELLVDVLQDKEIRTDAEQYIGQNNPSLAGLDTASEQRHGSSPTHARHPSSSLPQRTTRKSLSDGRHGPQTPSNSAGSVKSHGSSLVAALGMELINLLPCDDEGGDQTVTSIRAPGKYNLIGDQVVFDRGFSAYQHEVDESVPVYPRSGRQRLVNVKRAVDIAWRRRHELRSRKHTFYVVPAEMLDGDVILASDECLEREVPSDDQEAYLRQARFAQGFIREEEPDPPMARTYSYQQPHALPKVQRAFDRTYATRGTQREPAAEPFATATQSKHMDHGQPTQTTSPLAPQGRSSGQIQVTGQWDKTPIKLSFDPDASGEAFYQTFFQWAVKRKRGADLDRERTTLWLKASKATPDTQAYDLELKEDELEELWNTAVEWIQENKNTKAPHLYATVEMEAG